MKEFGTRTDARKDVQKNPVYTYLDKGVKRRRS